MPVPTRQLYEEFGVICTKDEIYRHITNMLIRDTTAARRSRFFIIERP